MNSSNIEQIEKMKTKWLALGFDEHFPSIHHFSSNKYVSNP